MTACLTLEKGWRPNIITERKLGTNSSQVILFEVVFQVINHCARTQASFQATEEVIGGAGRLKRNYLGCGWIKVVFNSSEASNGRSTLSMSLDRLDGLHSCRHDDASQLKVV